MRLVVTHVDRTTPFSHLAHDTPSRTERFRVRRFFPRGYHSRMTRREEIDEGPDDSDIKRFSDVTRTCPECRADVYDDAELCWQCGHAFAGSKSAPSKLTVVVVGLLILAFLFWYLRGLF